MCERTGRQTCDPYRNPSESKHRPRQKVDGYSWVPAVAPPKTTQNRHTCGRMHPVQKPNRLLLQTSYFPRPSHLLPNRRCTLCPNPTHEKTGPTRSAGPAPKGKLIILALLLFLWILRLGTHLRSGGLGLRLALLLLGLLLGIHLAKDVTLLEERPDVVARHVA